MSLWSFLRKQKAGSGEIALIDGKQHMAIVEEQNLIILEYSSNGQAQSLWSYAVNLKLREVTAAQVNSAVVFGMGSLKSRGNSASLQLNQSHFLLC